MKKKKKHAADIRFVTASISTSMVLLLLGMVAFFVLTAGNMSRYVRENLQLSVLIHDDARQNDIDRLMKRLSARPYVREVEFISQDSILAQETVKMGIDPTEFLGFNPYTPSIELNLKSDYANSDSVAVIEKELLREAIVSEVTYPDDLISSINGNIRKIGIVLLVLAAALLLISFALIDNTIRLTIYSQRFLLHTMKLVGAKWSFIRRPFMVRNFWTGFVAGLLALMMMGGGIWAMLRYEPFLANLLDVRILAIIAVGVMVFGILITLLCASISVNRFLRIRAGDLYYI